jgi:tRNA-guanine family transglycosylase
MVLDECIPNPAPRDAAERAVDRTLAWAARCRAAATRDDQALFGIVQGSLFPDLRERCARALVAMDFPGYAIGGLSVGEDRAAMDDCVEATMEHLPPGPAAVPDGRRRAARPGRVGGSGRGPLRLRAADAQRPERVDPRPRA